VGYPGSRVAMDVGVFGTPRGFVDRHVRVVAQLPGTWSSAVEGHRRLGPGWHGVPPRRVAARAVRPAVTTWVGRAGGLTWRGSRPASGGPAGGSQLTRCRRFPLRGARDTAGPAGGRPAAATCAETTATALCGCPRSSALAVSLVHSTPDRPGLPSPTIYPRGITRRDHRPLPGPSADRHKIAGGATSHLPPLIPIPGEGLSVRVVTGHQPCRNAAETRRLGGRDSELLASLDMEGRRGWPGTPLRIRHLVVATRRAAAPAWPSPSHWIARASIPPRCLVLVAAAGRASARLVSAVGRAQPARAGRSPGSGCRPAWPPRPPPAARPARTPAPYGPPPGRRWGRPPGRPSARRRSLGW
jgi:hypothetical protein